MPRWLLDDVDCACEAWAAQWVRHFARDPDRAGATIGPMPCTLGRVRELHDGASSTTDRRASQRWPEVFLGTALIVNCAVKAMSEASRIVLWSHYVARWYTPDTWSRRSRPVKQSIVAAELGLSVAEYYNRRDAAKHAVQVVLHLDPREFPELRRHLPLREQRARAAPAAASAS